MEGQVVVAVDIPLAGDERHKNWAKVVDNVDTSKSSGWAFDGEFIAAGGIQDVTAGSVVLVYGEKGSRLSPQSTARVYTVNPDATLTLEAEARGQAWARTLRDPIERLLGTERRLIDLTQLPDEVLVEELTARGWKVERP
ncbi:MAG TPA: hypothetical protein VFP42_13400 [Acidimicrobiia bacterium]|nr:hypothetical protein [Acidimicrobiia bacterium]